MTPPSTSMTRAWPAEHNAEPLGAEGLNCRGIARFVRRDPEGALDDFREAARLAPGYAEAWNNSGAVRQSRGRFREALADFDQAIALKPDYADALNNRGRARQALGDLAGAAADLERALACAGGRFAATVLHNRGVLRQELGDLRAALADFDRALEIDPGHVATYVNRGAARMEAGDLAGALTDFECAMAEAAPGTEAIIYHQRGGVRVLLNDFAGAIADYDRALALVPEDVVCYISRGNARYHRRDPGALADYRAAFHLDPESAAREVVRILAEDVRRRAEEVLDNCDQHLRISDRDLIAHARRGLTLVLLGREAEAAPDFARCRELAPDMDSCLSRVTRLSCQHRTTQGAVQL